jgi:menaquinone-dependent protoporphyrinogen oxidase
MSAGAILTYASRDGQARRIAQRIGHILETSPRDLKSEPPGSSELAAAPLLIVVAAVRYGKHLPEADDFINRYARLTARPPLVLASVNLTARKEGKRSAEGNAYLRKLIAQYHLEPAMATAFAGRLDYARYRWSDRQLIRFIMLLTGGPTDTSTCVEYTDWSAVDEFARQALRFSIEKRQKR